MIGTQVPAPDRDWWAPHVLVAVFGVLVAAILGAVPGWSAPLHAWITLAAIVIAALAAHAGVRAAAWAVRRRWRGAVLALLLAAALGGAASGMLMFGRWFKAAGEDAFAQARSPSARSVR